MSAFGGLKFTQKGRNLQAKALAGEVLQFTRIGIGDGHYTGSISDLSHIIHEVMSLPISRVSSSSGQARVFSAMSNQDLQTGFYLREIGVYAMDPDEGEVLYNYANAGEFAGYIPPAGGGDVVEKEVELIATVGTAANVTAIIDESLTFATLGYVTSKISVVQAELSAHSGNAGIHVTPAQKSAWNAKEDAAKKGQPDGFAPLDLSAKIPMIYLHDSIVGQVEYKSTWNAATNIPELPDATEAKGNYYVTETAGTFQDIEFKVGDWVISNGTEWQKVDNTDAVPTVFGRTGNIIAAPGDYTAEEISLDSPNFMASDVKGALEEVFQSVSDGKTLVAAAITDKGVPTAATDTFQQMADNIEDIATSSVGSAWDLIEIPNSTRIDAIAYGGGKFVALPASGGIVWVSEDGRNWRSVSIASGGAPLTGITYGGGLFVAVRSSNQLMISPDGYNWRAVTGLSSTWEDICYGAGTFVAVSNTTGGASQVMTSMDGVNWIGRAVPAGSNNWGAVTYGAGIFVAVAYNGGIMTSPDGITWTKRVSPSEEFWSSVTYGNGLFVAVSLGSGAVIRSTDGVTWSLSDSGTGVGRSDVAYGNGVFIAVSQNDPKNAMVSTDGISWSAKEAPGLTWLSLCYGNGVFVAASYEGLLMASGVVDDPTVPKEIGDRLPKPGIRWAVQVAPSGDQTSVFSVCYGDGLFVAVGASGGVLTSPDGATWTARKSAAGNNWTAVTYGNGMFVALSNNGTGNRIMTSPDGINWTLRNSPADNYWRSVTYGNGLFVAVSDKVVSGSNVMTSLDGVTWTTRVSPNINVDWLSVCFGNGLFVAVAALGTGNNSVMTSPDGITWTLRTSVANTWYAVCYGNELFVAVAYDSVMTSPDGITWTARVAPAGGSKFWNAVAYGNGMFAAISQDGSTGRVMTSPDGINWTIRAFSSSNDWRSICYGNGMFVAVSVTWSSPYRFVTSGELLDPTLPKEFEVRVIRPGVKWAISGYLSDRIWTSVCYGKGMFVAVAASGGSTETVAVTTTPDLDISWLGRPGHPYSWTSVCYSGGPSGTFVAVGNSGSGFRVMSSTDATTWLTRGSAADNDWRSVCYGNGIFVAVAQSGSGNRVMTSPDGATWTIRASAADNAWYSVCYGNGIFVAVAQSGTGNRVMTSPDGIIWTLRTSAADNNWTSVCYGGGLFVAVAASGNGNRVMTSPDGIIWTLRTSAENNAWRTVCYGNGLFVAVATTGAGRVMTSPDGILWSMKTIPTLAESLSWSGIAYGGGAFVSVPSSPTLSRSLVSSMS